MNIDYQIKVVCPGQTARVTCEVCVHAKVCQFKQEIFDEHGCDKHSINRLNLKNYVAMLCKHFNQYEIDWSPSNDANAEVPM